VVCVDDVDQARFPGFFLHKAGNKIATELADFRIFMTESAARQAEPKSSAKIHRCTIWNYISQAENRADG